VPLSKHEREQFFAEPHVAALSVADGPGRAPLTVPIWYQYSPGGEAWVKTEARSRKAQLIDAAGRFTLMVDRVEPTVRYVSVEGPVVGKTTATMNSCGRSPRDTCRWSRCLATSSSSRPSSASR
jgi:hypothetical protein